MFGLFDDVVEVTGRVAGVAVNSVVSPVTNTLEVVAGLTEGELRLKAIAALGADAALGMSVDALIEWYED